MKLAMILMCIFAVFMTACDSRSDRENDENESVLKQNSDNDNDNDNDNENENQRGEDKNPKEDD